MFASSQRVHIFNDAHWRRTCYHFKFRNPYESLKNEIHVQILIIQPILRESPLYLHQRFINSHAENYVKHPCKLADQSVENFKL